MISPYNFKMKYINGDIVDMHQKDLWVEDFSINSLSPEYVTSKIEGVDGLIPHGSTRAPRIITADFQIEGRDIIDFDLFRDEIFDIFRPGEEVTIIRDLQRGKAAKCFVDKDFDITPVTSEDGDFSVDFIMFYPLFQSIGTTQDIQINGINSDDALWGFGMGLVDDPDSHKYTHTGTSFKIYNAGNESIHPFNQQFLKITISNVQGSTSYFQLKNNTNGSLFRVNEAVNSQTILLDGPNITSNGLNYLRKTNKGFIELQPGWNEFEITGATSAKVEFDFRFYYR